MISWKKYCKDFSKNVGCTDAKVKSNKQLFQQFDVDFLRGDV